MGDGVLRSPNSNCNALYFIKTIDFLDPPGTLCLAILRLSRAGREALGQSACRLDAAFAPVPKEGAGHAPRVGKTRPQLGEVRSCAALGPPLSSPSLSSFQWVFRSSFPPAAGEVEAEETG
ncbi:hypothetical protein JCM30394_08900 [Deferrisoma palaeochoriense]